MVEPCYDSPMEGMKSPEPQKSAENEVMETIYEQARKADVIVAFTDIIDPQTNEEDPRIAQAVSLAKELRLPEPMLLMPDHYSKLPPEEKEQLIKTFENARKERGKPLQDGEAEKLLSTDPKYLAAAMTNIGLIDGYVAGNIASTGDALRPALQIIGTTEGYASSFFIMRFPDGSTKFFADCGFNYDPSAEQLAIIAITTARNAARLGIEPRVAFLSSSTAGSGSHAHVDKVRDAIAKARQMAPDLKIAEHELQLDAALRPEVAARKVGESEVAGKANVLVFPDLDSGNIAYKMASILGVESNGPLMQGLKKPASDLSRGSTPEEIVNVLAYTQMQAAALQRDSKEN